MEIYFENNVILLLAMFGFQKIWRKMQEKKNKEEK